MVISVEKLCGVVDGLKPAIVMVVVQVAMAGVNVLYKLISNRGISLRIIIAYRLIFASAFMLPLSFFLERGKRPKMTWTILSQLFLCGAFGGALTQNMYLQSVAFTSATFTSAMSNLVPAFTFILALCLRLERLGLKSMAGKAKVLGTLIGIGGAMVLTFYKGQAIDIWSTNVNLMNNVQDFHGHSRSLSNHSNAQVLGSLLSVCCCVCYASWLIIQAKVSVNYPCPYSATALMSIMGSIQATVYAVCMERDWKQWRLGWDIRLLTAAYSGIVASGLMVTLISWCVKVRGPLFVSVFNPLMLVLVAIASSFLLGEKLFLGSVIGAGLIICGLYTVLWGKGEEMKKLREVVAPSSALQEEETIKIIVRISASETEKNRTDINNCIYTEERQLGNFEEEIKEDRKVKEEEVEIDTSNSLSVDVETDQKQTSA